MYVLVLPDWNRDPSVLFPLATRCGVVLCLVDCVRGSLPRLSEDLHRAREHWQRSGSDLPGAFCSLPCTSTGSTQLAGRAGLSTRVFALVLTDFSQPHAFSKFLLFDAPA